MQSKILTTRRRPLFHIASVATTSNKRLFHSSLFHGQSNTKSNEEFNACECQYGFSRPDFKQDPLAAMQVHKQHLFVLTKEKSSEWSKMFENEGFAHSLKLSLKKQKKMLSIVSYAEMAPSDLGDASSESEYTVLVLPEMVRYTGLKESDIDLLVQDVCSLNNEGTSATTALKKENIPSDEAQIFVCAHSKRDMRCGVCGPKVIDALSDAIKSSEPLKATIRKITHVGGHKFAANVIIYQMNAQSGQVRGDWYGNVNELDAKRLVEEHMREHKIIKELWRGSPNAEPEQ